MYEIADKYDVLGLKDIVKAKFTTACDAYWNRAELAVAAHHVYSTTPDHDKGLRDILARTVSKHVAELVEKPEMEVLLTEFNGLAYGLLKELAKKLAD